MCYLGITGLLLLWGSSRAPVGGVVAHLVILATIAIATFHSRIPSILRAWTPLLALLFLYSELPMLIRATGHGRFFDMTVISWETALFGGQPAIEWAMRWPGRVLSETLHAAYLAYYPLIAIVPATLWFRRREAFPEAVFVLMLTFVACFICFIVFPVEGPRYLWPGTQPSGPIRSAAVALLEARSSRGTAFPSSHVAVATTQAVLAWRYFGWRGAGISAIALGLALGAVYGGFHYAVDVVAGGLLGGLVSYAGLALFGLIEATQAKAMAPTNVISSDLSESSTSSSGTAST